jgi:hypothetical protein
MRVKSWVTRQQIYLVLFLAKQTNIKKKKKRESLSHSKQSDGLFPPHQREKEKEGYGFY